MELKDLTTGDSRNGGTSAPSKKGAAPAMDGHSPLPAGDQPVTRRRAGAAAVIALLVGSLACVAIAPILMPDSYSVIEHSVSESAAQGVEGAWLARLGFLLLGFAVLLTASIAGSRWGVWGRLAHRLYGVSMIAAAAFSHMPWQEIPFDKFEDFLHSVSAYGVGFGFTAGVLIVTFQRGPNTRLARLFDWTAIIAAFVIPMVMFNVTGIAGAVQRIMFSIGYVWYAMENARNARAERTKTVIPVRRSDSPTRLSLIGSLHA